MGSVHPDPQSARVSREFYFSRTPARVRIEPASLWGQGERAALALVHAADPAAIVRPYLTAAGLISPASPMPAPGPGRVTLDAGTYLSACALACQERPEEDLSRRMRFVVGQLGRAAAVLARPAAPPGRVVGHDTGGLLAGLLDAAQGGKVREARALALAIAAHAPAGLVPDRGPGAGISGAIREAIGNLTLFLLGCQGGAGLAAARESWRALAASHVGPDGGVRAGAARGTEAKGGRDGGVPDEPADSEACQAGCPTMLMAELSAALLATGPSAPCADYLELALANFLAVTGPSVPWEGLAGDVPLGPAVRMDRARGPGSCCGQLSVLAPLRLRQAAFTLRGAEFFVNIAVPGTFEVPGSGAIALSRPSASTFVLTLGADPPSRLRIRWPSYAQQMWLGAAGRRVAASAGRDGYVTVPGERRAGERIEVRIAWEIRVIRSKQDPRLFALRYGPWLMVALTDEPSWLNWPPQLIASQLRRAGTAGPWQVVTIPLAPLRVAGQGAFHSVFRDPGPGRDPEGPGSCPDSPGSFLESPGSQPDSAGASRQGGAGPPGFRQ